ncbi:MAG: hydrogenase formation protein HypD [Candidatus Omnitrophota bacterium]
MFEFLRDKKITQKLIDKIALMSRGRHFKLMHVCGTHEQVIAQFGLRELLPDNLEIVSGPGCPVCCTPAFEIDWAIELAQRGCLITTFGDMLRVRGKTTSLLEARSKGAKIKVVYSISDALKIADNNPAQEVVHCAIGFETTAPTTALVLLNKAPRNFSIICSHKLIPPAMQALLEDKEVRIDGFIAPGHVSTIIGSKPYESIATKYKKPVVISGFEPVDILTSIWLVLKQIKDNKFSSQIEYRWAVRPNGNPRAIKAIKKVFDISDVYWRGLGKIPGSGLKLKKRFKKFDAVRKFSLREKNIFDIPKMCICDKILKGISYPDECGLFKNTCKPENPIGPCMVSSEGSCNIYYHYGKRWRLKTKKANLKT